MSRCANRRLSLSAALGGLVEELEQRTMLTYDLSGNYAYLSPDRNVNWGDTLTMENRIRNYGSESVTWPFSVGYYLSNDTTFGDADDVALGQYTYEGGVPAFGYGSYYTVSIPLPATAPAGYGGLGSFYIGIKTDVYNEVNESNESNNFGQEGLLSDYDNFSLYVPPSTAPAPDPGGQGDLSFVLTWGYNSVDEGPDIDLHVIDPSGVNWDYTRESSAHFDLDDRGQSGPGDGAGPERAYWSAPALGDYHFYADWYDNTSAATQANATINVYRKQWDGSQKLVATRTYTLSETAQESYHWNYTVSPIVTPPAMPTGLVVRPVATNQINLSWNDASSNETGFKIEQSKAGGAWTQIATVGAGITVYQAKSLESGVTYSYRVRSYNSAANSSYTAVQSAMTYLLTQPAATPGGQGELSFVLTWGYNSTDEGPDIDLHVVDPAGVNWDYTRENSAHFDLDDRGATGNGNGAGPERAWWNPAALGSYQFYGYWYENGSAASRADCTIRVYRQQAGGAQQLVDAKAFTLTSSARQSSRWTYNASAISKGPLVVSGTDGNDIVELNMVNGLLQTKVNSTTKYYGLGTISTITVNTANGADQVTLGTGVPATAINGGAGNDTLTGGDFGDTISGGADNDLIYGRLSRDVLNGDAGNDTIFGGRGMDSIYGGDGDDSLAGVGADDWIYGGLGSDKIEGGYGADHIFGDDGDDWIYARDGMSDIINGGNGTDRLQVDSGTLDSRTSIELLLA